MSQYNFPDKLILSIPEEIRWLENHLKRHRIYHVVDSYDLIAGFIWSIRVLSRPCVTTGDPPASKEIYTRVVTFLDESMQQWVNEGIINNIPDKDFANLFDGLLEIFNGLANKMLILGLYVDGVFPYEVISGDKRGTIILEFIASDMQSFPIFNSRI